LGFVLSLIALSDQGLSSKIAKGQFLSSHAVERYKCGHPRVSYLTHGVLVTFAITGLKQSLLIAKQPQSSGALRLLGRIFSIRALSNSMSKCGSSRRVSIGRKGLKYNPIFRSNIN
jgi:hypothetical protein